MIVIDSSVIVELLLDTPKAEAIGGIVVHQQRHAPDLIAFEVLSAIRGNLGARN